MFLNEKRAFREEVGFGDWESFGRVQGKWKSILGKGEQHRKAEWQEKGWSACGKVRPA